MCKDMEVKHAKQRVKFCIVEVECGAEAQNVICALAICCGPSI